MFVLAIFVPEVLNNTTANVDHLIKSLFFIPFDKNGTGHFPILFLGWTLNFEVIFYFLFALSLVFFKEVAVGPICFFRVFVLPCGVGCIYTCYFFVHMSSVVLYSVTAGLFPQDTKGINKKSK